MCGGPTARATRGASTFQSGCPALECTDEQAYRMLERWLAYRAG